MSTNRGPEGRKIHLWFIVSINLALPVGILIWTFFRPLQILDALLKLAALMFPLIWFEWKWLLSKFQESKGRHLRTLIVCTMTVPSLTSIPILINGYNDESLPNLYTSIIIAKREKIGKNRTRSYRVYIASPKPEKFALPYSDWIGIGVSSDLYQNVEVGHHKGTVVIKNGRLGIPWVESSRLEEISAQN